MASPEGTKNDRVRRRLLALGAAGVLVEKAAVGRRGYGWGGKVIVRCRDGHLFTTIWIPGASLKSLRLGLWRVQRCPAGRHWSVVRPVRASDLSDEECRTAGELRDLRIP